MIFSNPILFVLLLVGLIIGAFILFDRLVGNTTLDEERPTTSHKTSGELVPTIFLIGWDWVVGSAARLIAKITRLENLGLRFVLTIAISVAGYFGTGYMLNTFGNAGIFAMIWIGAIALTSAITAVRAMEPNELYLMAGLFAFWLTTASGHVHADAVTNEMDWVLPALAGIMWFQWVYGTVKEATRFRM